MEPSLNERVQQLIERFEPRVERLEKAVVEARAQLTALEIEVAQEQALLVALQLWRKQCQVPPAPCQQQSTGRLQLPPQSPARPSGPDGSTVQR